MLGRTGLLAMRLAAGRRLLHKGVDSTSPIRFTSSGEEARLNPSILCRSRGEGAPEKFHSAFTINAFHLEYETEKGHYAHIDCPGYADYIKMITGAAQMEGAILVVAATDGAIPQTKERLLLAPQSDEVQDAEPRELVEMEIREVLNQFDYNGTDLPLYVLKPSEGRAKTPFANYFHAGLQDEEEADGEMERLGFNLYGEMTKKRVKTDYSNSPTDNQTGKPFEDASQTVT